MALTISDMMALVAPTPRLPQPAVVALAVPTILPELKLMEAQELRDDECGADETDEESKSGEGRENVGETN
jgi:hypothetical protein